jgi:exodeoxyribonuclease VII small subunit
MREGAGRKTMKEPKTDRTSAADSDPGFEDALNELEGLVVALETGELGLDEALARYELGVRLLARCRALLDGAERRVALLTGVDSDGNPLTASFDAAATVASDPAK